MRIVFMGTPEFAIPSLRILLEHNYDLAAVVTTPDKPAGRGRQMSQSPTKVFARRHNLNILQPEKLKDVVFIDQLKSLQPQLCVVVAFRILPPEVFTIPKFGSFNLHASLLPRYRGAAPINWAIIRGEKETGVSTFFLKETVDTGSIILQARVPIRKDDTAGDLHDTLAEVGAEIVLHSVRLIELGKVVPQPQDDAIASNAPKILKEHCVIDWEKSSIEVHNFIRGLSPRPCAYTFHNGTMLKIYRSRLVDDSKSAMPGQIISTGRRLLVGVAGGALEIVELQQEGKKRLPAEQFLRGYRLRAGEMFTR